MIMTVVLRSVYMKKLIFKELDYIYIYMDTLKQNKMNKNANNKQTSAWDDGDDWHTVIEQPKVVSKVVSNKEPIKAVIKEPVKTVIKEESWEDNLDNNLVNDTQLNTNLVNKEEDDVVDEPVDDVVDEPVVNETVVDEPVVVKDDVMSLVRYRFDEMDLNRGLLRSIYAEGKDTPSKCQQYIPLLIKSNRDFIGQGATGTGKTLLFLAAAIQFASELETLDDLLVIIIAHSRELALQIFQSACVYTQFTNVSVALHRGVGKNSQDAVRYMSNEKPNVRPGHEKIIIATPGRLLDLLTSDKRIRLSNSISINRLNTGLVGLLIIDEADDLLKLENKPKNNEDNNDKIIDIFKSIETFEVCKKIIISATMPKILLQICDNFLVDPIELLLTNEEISNQSSILHYYVEVEEQYKLDCLIDLIETKSPSIAQVFFNSKEKAVHIYRELSKKNFSVACIHGDLSQGERDNIMKMFKESKIKILLSTDLIARGIDMGSVSCVFNWNLPSNSETYQHRAGRCGRYNRKGASIIFTSNLSEVKELSRYTNLKIESLPMSAML